MAQPGSLMQGESGDPRLHAEERQVLDAIEYSREKEVLASREKELNSNEKHQGSSIKPQQRLIHDPDVSFAEYYHYSRQTRAEEETHPTVGKTGVMGILFPSKSGPGAGHTSDEDEAKENNVHVTGSLEARAVISDDEWAQASRALRTATQGTAFYLITTDILGPFGLPYAIATVGWG